jgi:hypothetical protein
MLAHLPSGVDAPSLISSAVWRPWRSNGGAQTQKIASLDQRRPGDLGLAIWKMARETGLEPATSGVTGRRSNQLSYSRAGRFL